MGIGYNNSFLIQKGGSRTTAQAILIFLQHWAGWSGLIVSMIMTTKCVNLRLFIHIYLFKSFIAQNLLQ